MTLSSNELGEEGRKRQMNFKHYSNNFQKYAKTINPRRQSNDSISSNSTNNQTLPLDMNKENLYDHHMVILTNIEAENQKSVQEIVQDVENKSKRSSDGDDEEVQAINTFAQICNENDDNRQNSRSGRSNPAIPTAEIVCRDPNFDLFEGLNKKNATLSD